MSKTPVTQPQDKYVLRMPDGLRDRIKDAADAAGRSMNAEIVRVLLEAFPDPSPQRLSLRQVLELTEAFENAMGPDHDHIVTSDFLRMVYRIDQGDTGVVDEDVARLIREKLEQFRSEK